MTPREADKLIKSGATIRIVETSSGDSSLVRITKRERSYIHILDEAGNAGKVFAADFEVKP